MYTIIRRQPIIVILKRQAPNSNTQKKIIKKTQTNNISFDKFKLSSFSTSYLQTNTCHVYRGSRSRIYEHSMFFIRFCKYFVIHYLSVNFWEKCNESKSIIYYQKQLISVGSYSNNDLQLSCKLTIILSIRMYF